MLNVLRIRVSRFLQYKQRLLQGDFGSHQFMVSNGESIGLLRNKCDGNKNEQKETEVVKGGRTDGVNERVPEKKGGIVDRFRGFGDGFGRRAGVRLRLAVQRSPILDS